LGHKIETARLVRKRDWVRDSIQKFGKSKISFRCTLGYGCIIETSRQYRIIYKILGCTVLA
jgi:hypothetical protein